jgi:hypothetical protein
MTAFALTAGGAWAQLTPNGDEIQVNTYTTSAQQLPAIAADAAGDFVVAWQSAGSSGSDTSGLSIQAQQFAADGTPLGNELQVNTYTTNDQQVPEVGTDAAGNFVVSWYSYGSAGTDTSGDSVQAQLYDLNGLPVGSQFQVNTYTTEHQRRSALLFDAQGNFTIVWAGWAPSGDTDIQGQRYDANGVPLGGEFLVNTYTPGRQQRVDIAADAAGNFVVVWQSFGSNGSDTSDDSIQARRYDADGNPLAAQFQVNTYTTNGQRNPEVGMDDAGNFVVVWGSLGSSGSDTSFSSILGQRYDASGLPVGAEFQVNTSTSGYQQYPSVAHDSDGDFVVAWQSEVSSGSDASGLSIQAQHFAADGTPLGGESQVNTYTTSNQQFPAVATNREGRFVVAWESFGSGGTDTDTTSIQAQRFDVPLPFRDGFERGDTSRWSGTVP